MHIKAYLLTALLLAVYTTSLFGQKPDWIDPKKRDAAYPENTYLMGYVSELNVFPESSGKMLTKLTDAARTQLINSVIVNLKSVSDTYVENEESGGTVQSKTETIERMQTSSNMMLANLVTETFYDKKKKQAHAFCYVSKTKVKSFYRKQAEEFLAKANAQFSEGKNLYAAAMNQRTNPEAFAAQNKKAIPVLFSAHTNIEKIQDAYNILQAMNATMGVEVDETDLEKKRNELKDMTSNILGSTFNNLDDGIFFLVYGLKMQLGEDELPVSIDGFSYESSGVEGDLSQRIISGLKSTLLSAGGFAIKSPAAGVFKLDGHYEVEGDAVRLVSQLLSPSGKSKEAYADTKVKKDHFLNQGIQIIPGQLRKLEEMKQTTLVAVTQKVKVKTGKPGENLEAKLEFSASNANGDLGNVPVIFTHVGNKEVLGTVLTNGAGVAIFHPEKMMKPSPQVQIVEAKVDMAKMLGMDPSSQAFKDAVSGVKIPKTRFFVDVANLSLYIEEEKFGGGNNSNSNQSGNQESKFIGEIRACLSEDGYIFVPDISDADLVLNLRGLKENQQKGSFHYTYVTVTASLMNIDSGETILSLNEEGIKGAGSSFSVSESKAYSKATKSTCRALEKALSND